MNQHERAELVRHIKYVDEVIENCPWILLPDFLEKYQVRSFSHFLTSFSVGLILFLSEYSIIITLNTKKGND